jgi:glyoxylase-like metal-dependent hydrolase (beta-lactamase superfamily II)
MASKRRHELRRARDQVELALFDDRGAAPTSGAEVARTLEGEAQERLAALVAIAEGHGDRAAYRDQWGVAGVRSFQTAGGAQIYQLAVETFPDHVNNVYLIVESGRALLYDCGSQQASSQKELERGGELVSKVFGAPAGLDEVRDLILSHAHIDHFGGVGAWRGRARIHVHELDARVVTRFEERIVTAAMQLRVFLERAGVDPSVRAELEQMYVFTKRLFESVPVDRRLRDGDTVNGYQVHHVPGHCPGQICLQVHDVMLTADHVLPRITPHQSPESITPWTGLDHYFQSLEKLKRVGPVSLALPGHQEPILDLRRRIDEIVAFHERRLEEVRALCREPSTVAEVAAKLFGPQSGYGRLLALEEAAAHVEYLARRADLVLDNLDELVKAENPILRYRAAA